MSFKCPTCNNSDSKFIGYKNGLPYCRKCILFSNFHNLIPNKSSKTSIIDLPYELSNEQKLLSNELLNNFINHKNSLVHAVCGSGKTEIVLNVIAYAISKGLSVGFAIPRKDVVREIEIRLKGIFKANTVISVYGGHYDFLEADIVCLTTHQLFRYKDYFDLLILDEMDAFPYKNSDILYSMFKRSIKGNYILLSATASKVFVQEFKKDGNEVLELFTRFHGNPLTVPELCKKGKLETITFLRKKIKEFECNNKQLFIFVPTIEKCEKLYNSLSLFVKNGNYVHSKKPDRSQIIYDFRKQKYSFLVTTSVLERGVTVKDLQVIVIDANHKVFDMATLVQIAGRAGRKKEAPEGEVIFIGEEITDDMESARNEIISANKSLQNMF